MRKLSKEQVLLLHTQLIEEYAELLVGKKEACQFVKSPVEVHFIWTANVDNGV